MALPIIPCYSLRWISNYRYKPAGLEGVARYQLKISLLIAVKGATLARVWKAKVYCHGAHLSPHFEFSAISSQLSASDNCGRGHNPAPCPWPMYNYVHVHICTYIYMYMLQRWRTQVGVVRSSWRMFAHGLVDLVQSRCQNLLIILTAIVKTGKGTGLINIIRWYPLVWSPNL